METSEIYSMRKHCQATSSNDEYSRKMRLAINLTGALIRSHDDYLSESSIDNGIYPDNLSCELVAEAPVGSKIMLLIQSMNIPTDNVLCDENYLYVFDYGSSRSKAMTAAGGEKGLCGRTFPREPIITTGPRITIVFNSKIPSHRVPNDAGFMLTLTEIVPVEKDKPCQDDRYRCGHVPVKEYRVQRMVRTPYNRPGWNIGGAQTQPVTVARQTSSGKGETRTLVDYCIPLGLLCDGVRNCDDSSDEDSRTRIFCSELQKAGIIHRFLSLGLSASITIAVGCIVVVTLCMGVTACYCMRLCTAGLQTRQAQQHKDGAIATHYQGMVISSPMGHTGNGTEGYYTSPFIPPAPTCITIRDNSSVSSCDTDMVHGNHSRSYMQVNGRPASDKLCNWGTSSLVSYPSNCESHHSHPETQYLSREVSKSNRSNHHSCDRTHRPPVSNPRCHHSSYSHHTPKSSRSGKSTRSTKSTNIDAKHPQTYPLTFDDTVIRVLGPVLGQV